MEVILPIKFANLIQASVRSIRQISFMLVKHVTYRQNWHVDERGGHKHKRAFYFVPFSPIFHLIFLLFCTKLLCYFIRDINIP